MKVSKIYLFAAAALLTASSVMAQTAPPQNPPAQPPAEQKPAAPAPQPAQPPKPFPEGAKIAYLDIQAVASTSVEGKAASQQIQAYVKKKTDELQAKNKQATDIQTKLSQSGSVLSEAARAQNEKELQKLQRELQNMQEDAQAEQQEMTEKLQAAFQEKLNPIIEAVATEKGLHVVLDARNSGLVWANAGIDITAEVIKRFDAAKTAPKK
jgi:outer membrane protein